MATPSGGVLAYSVASSADLDHGGALFVARPEVAAGRGEAPDTASP